jgi:hypothetical protein
MMRSGNRGTHLEVIQSLRYVCFTVLPTCHRQQHRQRPHGPEWSRAATSGKLTPGGITDPTDPDLRL